MSGIGGLCRTRSTSLSSSLMPLSNPLGLVSILVGLLITLHFVRSNVILPLNSVLAVDYDEAVDDGRRALSSAESNMDSAARYQQSKKRSVDPTILDSSPISYDESGEPLPKSAQGLLSFLSSKQLGGSGGTGCYCCKAFACRWQSCPCSKFFL